MLRHVGLIVTQADRLGATSHADRVSELILQVTLRQFFHFSRLLRNELGGLQAALILLLQHVDLEVVMSLEEAKLIFKSAHGLLRANIFLLNLLGKLGLKLAILAFEDFKHFLLVLQLILETLSHLLELFDIILHVLKQLLLLGLSFLLVVGLLRLLKSHILLELVEQG